MMCNNVCRCRSTFRPGIKYTNWKSWYGVVYKDGEEVWSGYALNLLIQNTPGAALRAAEKKVKEFRKAQRKGWET